MVKNISAPLIRTARLLDLVPYLNSHQGIALKDLAAHFDVSTAQMNADLTTLWMCGLPGYTPLELMDLEFESGYVTIHNAATLSKPRSITFQEGVALLLGLDLVASSLPSERLDLLEAVGSLSERISKILGVPIKLSATSHLSGSIASTISEAIENEAGLQIQYHSLYRDVISSRTVKPLHIYDSGDYQYMRAYCFSALDMREFRLDRITQAVIAEVPQSFATTDADVQKVNFSFTSRLSSRDVAERFALTDISIGSTISQDSYSRQWIQRSVMASGACIELNWPSEIRADIAATAQSMLDRYKAE